MTIRSRHIELTADNAGSAAGSIGAPTARYAGCYYTFAPADTASVLNIQNMRRQVFHKTGATNADAPDDLLPVGEKLIHGDLVFSAAGLQPGTVVSLTTFLDV